MSSYARTPEIRAKARAAQMGRHPTPETRAKISAAGLGNQNALGYTHTEESRAKMRAAQGRHQNHLMHGHARRQGNSSTYTSWCSMRQRCNNPNAGAYTRYGGRGITIDPRWSLFENFLADMGEKPDGLTLDRIDNDGNYTPENCRWATSREQALNRGHHCPGCICGRAK